MSRRRTLPASLPPKLPTAAVRMQRFSGAPDVAAGQFCMPPLPLPGVTAATRTALRLHAAGAGRFGT